MKPRRPTWTLKRYHLERGAGRVAALRGLLASRAVQRLRLLARQAPGRGLSRVGRLRDPRSRRRWCSRSTRSSASCTVASVRGDERARCVGVTAAATPDWLMQAEVGLCPCGCIGKRKKGGFVEKTIGGGSGRDAPGDVLRRHRVEARAAPGPRPTGETRDALVAAGHAPRWCVTSRCCSRMYVATLVLAVDVGLPLGFFIKRVWLFIPVFTGIIVAPATSEPRHARAHRRAPRHVVRPPGRADAAGPRRGRPHRDARRGLDLARRAAHAHDGVEPLARVAARALRAACSCSCSAMTYRYLFHLLNGVTDMYTARKARTVTRDSDVTKGRAFVAATGGALFGKAHALRRSALRDGVARLHRQHPHAARHARASRRRCLGGCVCCVHRRGDRW